MPQQVVSSVPVRSTPPARGLASDVFRGVVLGDFDQQLGAAGAAVQSAVGFVPVVGTITALRDLLACIGQRDPLGIVLNLLAIFPVFGGLAKTADALHALHRYQRASQRRKQGAMAPATYPAYQPYPPYPAYQAPVSPSTARRSGGASFALSLLVACIAALYGIGSRTLWEFLRVHGPVILGYALRGDGAWVAPLMLVSLGLLVGLIVTVSNRLWLGLVLFPVALAVGCSIYVSWW